MLRYPVLLCEFMKLSETASPVLMTSKRIVAAFVIYMAVLAIGSVLCVAIDYPAPRGDDAVYKSPGAEWATHGKFSIPALTGLLRTAKDGFAHYPPLYPLFFGLWYLAWGFSLQSTLACAHLIHIIHTMLVGMVTYRLLSVAVRKSLATQTLLTMAVMGTTFANCAYFDRPEELGLCLVWWGFWRWGMAARPLRWMDFAGWGSALGIAALVAPFTGLLAALTVTLRTLLEGGRLQRDRRLDGRTGTALVGKLIMAAAVSMTMVVAWIVLVERQVPGILRDQLLEGNLAFSAGFRHLTWFERLMEIPKNFAFQPPQLPVALVGLFSVPMAWLNRGLRNGPLAIIWCTVVASILLVVVVRPTAYTYFGATLALCAPCFALAMSRFLPESPDWQRLLTWCLVACCVLVSYRDLFQFARSWTHLPTEEQALVAQERLHSWISPGELVAVTSRHWYAFQGRNPWREAFFSTLRSDEEIRRCKWLVLTPESGKPFYLDAFELVAATSVSASRDRTYAYTLWRRKSSGDEKSTHWDESARRFEAARQPQS